MKKTIVDLFEASVSKYPNNTFLLEKTGKQFDMGSGSALWLCGQ